MSSHQLIQPIGILGGTFDPIHFGHLRMAVEIYQKLNLKEVRLIPCQQPVHKEKLGASAAQRLHMLELALQDEAGLLIDTRELMRKTPSYMVYTLESLQKEFPNTPLVLIMGMDALANFDSWYQWQTILNLSHIVAISRPGCSLALQGELGYEISKRLVSDKKALHQSLSGCILLQTTTLLDISATEIRSLIIQNKSVRYLIPDNVWRYIVDHNLYKN